MNPILTKISATYKRTDTDLWVLNTSNIPIPKEKIQDQQIVHFAPKSFGGNHKHPRTEWFVGIGAELELIWLDEHGVKHFENMNPNGQLFLIEMPPNVPHAVVNQSETHDATMIEFADAIMSDKEHDVVYE